MIGVYGVKTGFTNNAGRCLVTSTCRNNLDIITVVLGCDTKKFRTSDSLKLINYVFANYEIYNLSDVVNKEFQKFLKEFKNNIYIQKSNTIPLFKLENSSLNIPLKKEEYKNLSLSTNYTSTLSPEIYPNSSIGTISIATNDVLLKNVSILLENKLIYKTWNIYLWEFLKNFREICNYTIKNLI